MDILELIKKYGAEIPEDKVKDFDKEFRKTYKHESELSTANAKIDNLQTQLSDASKRIEDFKGMDIEGIKKAADEWKEKAEKAAKDADDKVNALKFDHTLEAELAKAKAKNPKAVRALLDAEALKLQEDGSILGLKEQLEGIKTENDYMFDSDDKPPKLVRPTTTTNTDTSQVWTLRDAVKDKLKGD